MTGAKRPADASPLPGSGRPAPPRRVLYLLDSLGAGGAERQLLTLVRGLDRRRYEPRLICIDAFGPLYDEAVALGLEPRLLGRHGAVDTATQVARLAGIIRRERPGIVHGWLWLANFYGRLAGRLGGAPVVIAGVRAAHRAALNPHKEPLFGAIDRALAGLTDCFTANSASVKAHLTAQGVPGRKVVVIPNGIAVPDPPTAALVAGLRADLGLDPARPVVGMVARLHAEFKDHPTFLRAAALVRGTVPAAAFVVVGDGPARPALERLAAALGLDGHVVFTGYRADSRTLAAAFTVGALCSFSEGFPNAVLEAMAWGRPVVATDLPATREIVTDGVTGRLVPPRDPAATAAAISRLLTHPAEAAALGAAARARVVQAFSAEATVARTMRLYDALPARRGLDHGGAVGRHPHVR